MFHRSSVGWTCLLYTSDAADERSSVDLGGRRIIKKKKKVHLRGSHEMNKKNKQNTPRSERKQHDKETETC